MSLNYQTFVLGPIENNTYLLWDEETRLAVVIDPSFDPAPLVEAMESKNLTLTGIWLTHAHFDHTAGIPDLEAATKVHVPVWLQQDDLQLYKTGGGASFFDFTMPELPNPAGFFEDGQVLRIGTGRIAVRTTPGHCQGHVIFYAAEISTAFTGDLIFRQGVGRTDLPGSNHKNLLKSINLQVLTLPAETVLLSGHGEATTVQEEIDFNPYLN
ncbi:MAG: MBL fold metallo-hydrolase [Leptolinea sp.]